ncbi:hypothetical protein, partial [Burkholderia sp. SIMBA_024]|uniref:hypothetical protein n=1 Tax=Burkholderia sp. SIMBA_024 TaxID=3085768 RepID=UPI00397A6CBF
NASLSVDYFSWDIKDEVDQLSGDQLLLQEYYCRLGQTGPGFTSCDNVAAWIVRDPTTEQLKSVFTPKVNIARQKLDVLTVSGR